MHLLILVYYDDELIMPTGPMNWTSARKPIILRPMMAAAQSRNRLGRIFLRFALPLTLGLVFLAQLAIVPNTTRNLEYSGNRMTNDTLRYAPEDIAAGVIDTYCISDTLVYFSLCLFFFSSRVNITAKPMLFVEHCQQPCGFLTVSDRGRLGNMMSQYATLFAFARKFNMKAVISTTMSATLRRVFPNLSIPTVKYESQIYNWTVVEVEDLRSLEGREKDIEKFRGMNALIGGFPAELPIFDAYRNSLSLTTEFKLEKLTEVAAKGFLQKTKTVAKSQITVGVHVRRMDYSVWLEKKVNGRLLSKLYFQKAMDYFRDKYTTAQSNVTFIVASDDKTWCREMFKDSPDVVFTPRKPGEKSVVFDLAVLALCNHSITR